MDEIESIGRGVGPTLESLGLSEDLLVPSKPHAAPAANLAGAEFF